MTKIREGYKETEIGVIPEDWETKKVESFTISHKQGYYTKDEYVGEGISLVRVTDLQYSKISFDGMPKLKVSDVDFNNYKINVGDFIFARSGSIGRYGIVTEDIPAIFGSYLIRFVFNQNIIDNRYFGLVYESDIVKKQLKGIIQGTSNININANNIKKLVVPIPSLIEQQRIALIFSATDAHIEKLDKIIEDYQLLKKGIMKKLLTEGISHTGFKETEIGRIPQDWVVKSLGDVVDVRDGTHDSPKQLSKGIPLITSKNLKPTGLDLAELTYISEDDHRNISKRSKVDKGDIIFAMIGTIGNPVIIDVDFEFSIKNVALLKFEKSYMNNLFIKNLLESSIISNQFTQKKTGGVQKFVSLGLIRNTLIPVPSIEEQQQIGSILSELENRINLYQQEKEHFVQLKSTLMEQLLTGKIRVNHW